MGKSLARVGRRINLNGRDNFVDIGVDGRIILTLGMSICSLFYEAPSVTETILRRMKG
jgi:hypothetical protein